ncbi:MAG: hypothetical protein LW825_02495 [Candidatus Jidaibacter sp.]|jgi:hypothetical protein|nr:hypothetical protein [Candidatus Jidaibacter sp.]
MLDISDIVEALEQNDPSLTCLNIFNTLIRDDDPKAIAEALKGNTTLISINLSGNLIRDNGATAIAEALKGNTTLISINLSCNRIRDDGATAIAEALKESSTLTFLNLSYNKIGNDGAKAIAEALKKKTTFIYLNLFLNYIRHAGIADLSKAMKGNPYINIMHAKVADLSEAIKDNPHILHAPYGDNGIWQEAIDIFDKRQNMVQKLIIDYKADTASIYNLAKYLKPIEYLSGGKIKQLDIKSYISKSIYEYTCRSEYNSKLELHGEVVNIILNELNEKDICNYLEAFCIRNSKKASSRIADEKKELRGERQLASNRIIKLISFSCIYAMAACTALESIPMPAIPVNSTSVTIACTSANIAYIAYQYLKSPSRSDISLGL